MSLPFDIAARLRLIYEEQGARGAYRKVRHAVRYHYRTWLARLRRPYPDLQQLATRTVLVDQAVRVPMSFGVSAEEEVHNRFRRLYPALSVDKRTVLDFTDATVLAGRSQIGVGSYRVKIGAVGNNVFPYVTGDQERTPNGQTRTQANHIFLVSGERRAFPMWFYEQLPKVYWYERYLQETGDRPQLVFAGPLLPFMRESLQLLGYPPTAYQVLAPEEVARYERVSVPPHPIRNRGSEMQVCPAALRWIAERIEKGSTDRAADLPQRVYISRADALYRRVMNEKEVRTLVASYGFETLELSHLPLQQQFALFRHATHIVGPHGAGLVHLLHGSGARVLELHPRTGISAHFAVLANECGHTYHYMLCDRAPYSRVSARYSDMAVDTTRLEQHLVALLGRH